MHEATLHEESCFLTLTYDDLNLPYGGTLVKAHFQRFMKKLRRFAKKKMTYFHCGEYGERYGRPHYHACVFGYDFPDKVFFKEKNGHKLYRSPILERLWHQGTSLIGAVSFDSAAYVARYVVKKVTGPEAPGWYQRQKIEPSTGEIIQVQLLPEYTTMSLKPAIGRGWLDKFMDETYRNDSVVARGVEMKPPKYYDKLFEISDAEAFAELKHERRKAAGTIKNRLNCTPERLAVREAVKSAQLTQLKREVE